MFPGLHFTIARVDLLFFLVNYLLFMSFLIVFSLPAYAAFFIFVCSESLSFVGLFVCVCD